MIPFSEPNIGEREKQYVAQAMSSGWVGSKGDFIDRFEAKFAKYIGVIHAITTSSGTTALMLAYHALGMNQTAKVIVPDTTFIATINMAKLFTDKIEERPVNKDTWTLDLPDLGANFVVGVHLYGNPCDMGTLYRQKYTFLEDCAQSLGSKFKGKMCGSFGLASIFSFHSAKGISTGEGGMVCTNSDEVAKRVRHLKNHSMLTPYQHTGMGYNARMTNVQAAMGLAQLERIDELNEAKRRATKFYDENLSKSFIRQRPQRSSDQVKWANAYKLLPEQGQQSLLQSLRRRLSEKGIETRPGFLGDDTIVLPCSTLLTRADLETVVREANASAT